MRNEKLEALVNQDRRDRQNDRGRQADTSSMDKLISDTQEAIKNAFIVKKKVRARPKDTKMLDAQA
jgi:hypothetical protein